jgi:gliding motility-associated-like protein
LEGNVSNTATVKIQLSVDPAKDSDGDWVLDVVEDINKNGNPCDDDTDGDGLPNYKDVDDDGDGVLTIFEDINKNGNPTDDDSDGDGIANYLDADDDDDCTSTKDEVAFFNGDYLKDIDNDGIPNYLDNDANGDGISDCLQMEDRDNNGIPDRDEVWNSRAQKDYMPIGVNATVIIPILENDSITMDQRTVHIINDPSHGYLDIDETDWTIAYRPDVDFIGLDSFIYVVCDYYDICDTATVIINIQDYIEIPQLFTPNGDGKNDVFVIRGLEQYTQNRIMIYNRWGNLVYEADGYLSDWNGTSNVKTALGDNILPVGTYYYILNYGQNRSKAGAVFLER